MPQKSFALDSSSLTAIKKRNVILNTLLKNIGGTVTSNEYNKNGKTQISKAQLGYENVSAIYFQTGKNIIA
jgi:hypothetical protein